MIFYVVTDTARQYRKSTTWFTIKHVRVQEYHAWEVKSLGRRLRLLASSDTCRVQAFVHRSRPIYGVQFHPEQASENCPDGFKVLRNFFRLARACRKGDKARR